MSGELSAAIVAAAEGCNAPIGVTGDSESARRVRELLADRGLDREEWGSPATVIEMTGTARGLAEALERVANLGTVLIAGPLPDDPVTLDLHDHVHVRGLTLIGIDPDGEITT